MHATRAAVEEGIVPGGGVALVRAARRSTSSRRTRKARATPTSRSASPSSAVRSKSRFARSSQNAGKEGAVVVGKVREAKDDNLRLQRRDREVRRPRRGRRHRPRKGHPHRAAERSLDRRPDADDRSHDRRDPGGRQDAGACRAAWAAAWACKRPAPADSVKEAPFRNGRGLFFYTTFLNPLRLSVVMPFRSGPRKRRLASVRGGASVRGKARVRPRRLRG